MVFAADDERYWIDNLKNRVGRSDVLMRVDRLIHESPDLHSNITDGLSELKINGARGYRVYYSFAENSFFSSSEAALRLLRTSTLKRP